MLERGAADRCLHFPLGPEVGHELLRLLVRPERTHQHEPPDARLLRGGDEVACGIRHHAPEVVGPARQDRDEVDDRLAACDRPP